jgi:hypothetical protein
MAMVVSQLWLVGVSSCAWPNEKSQKLINARQSSTIDRSETVPKAAIQLAQAIATDPSPGISKLVDV